jgi:hypothetical protein
MQQRDQSHAFSPGLYATAAYDHHAQLVDIVMNIRSKVSDRFMNSSHTHGSQELL